MMCERCKFKEATIHYFESMGGRQRTVNLCDGCAAKADDLALAGAGYLEDAQSSIPPPLTLYPCTMCGKRDGTHNLGRVLKYAKEDENALKHTDLVAQVSRFGRAGGTNAVQMVLSGLFERFPNLRILWAENQIGWIPFYMDMADVRYKRHIHWTEKLLGFKPLKELPSHYLQENCWWGFQIDPTGVEMRHHMGVDHLVWASDFPHQESEWPNDAEMNERNFAGVPAEERHKMVCDNIVEFLHLDVD